MKIIGLYLFVLVLTACSFGDDKNDHRTGSTSSESAGDSSDCLETRVWQPPTAENSQLIIPLPTSMDLCSLTLLTLHNGAEYVPYAAQIPYGAVLVFDEIPPVSTELLLLGNALETAATRGIRTGITNFEAGKFVFPSALVIGNTGSISGTVVSRDLSPVQGATVAIVGTAYSTTTGASGEFDLSAIPPGNHDLIAQHESFGYAQSSMIEVQSDISSNLGNLPLVLAASDSPQILLDNGADSTNVYHVAVSLRPPPGMSFVKISAQKSFADAAWQKLHSSTTFDFSHAGEQVLYATFSDRHGTVFSEIFSDSIEINPYAEGSFSLQVVTGDVDSPNIPSFSARITYPTEATHYRIAILNSPFTFAWEAVKGDISFSLPHDRSACGAHEIVVYLKDAQNLISIGQTAEINYHCFKELTTDSGIVLARKSAAAVWTGTEYLVWGNTDTENPGNPGYRYNPTSGAMTSMPATNEPSGRLEPKGLWVANKFVVIGGTAGVTGSIFDPTANANVGEWTPISASSAPSARTRSCIAASSTHVYIWGGKAVADSSLLDDGYKLDVTTNTWSALNSGPLTARELSGCTWVEAVNGFAVWGGRAIFQYLDTGALYSENSQTWINISPTGAPSGRASAGMVANSEAIVVFGGFNSGGSLGNGGKLFLNSNSWGALPIASAPEGGIYDPTVIVSDGKIIFTDGRNVSSFDDGASVLATKYIPFRFLTEESLEWGVHSRSISLHREADLHSDYSDSVTVMPNKNSGISIRDDKVHSFLFP